MISSESIKQLVSALLKAQSGMENVKKDKDNPFFKSKYADLSSVWDACKPQLLANGLTIIQAPGKDAEGHYVETILAHQSGEWISSKTYAKPVKDDPQAIGSAITYARRYGMQAIVGLCPEDDDGEAAMGRNQSTKQTSQKRSNQTDDEL